MPAVVQMVLGTVLTTLGGMAMKLMTREAIEWVILYGAKRLAERTDTPHDDEFVAKIEELVKK